MGKYRIYAVLKPDTNKVIDKIIECATDQEAERIGKDEAWNLYTKYEGTSKDIPSYDNLRTKYWDLWLDMDEDEFESTIADMYIKSICENVTYEIEKVKDE